MNLKIFVSKTGPVSLVAAVNPETDQLLNKFISIKAKSNGGDELYKHTQDQDWYFMKKWARDKGHTVIE